MLQILNNHFEIVDTLKKYTFAQYEDKFREIGTFKVLAQLVEENKYLLKDRKQYYILFDEYTIGKIDKIVKDSDSEYEKTITITGRLAPVLFSQRVINGLVTFKGTSVDYMVTLLQMCFALDDSTSSRYVGIDLSTDEISKNKELSTVDKQVTGGYLWDELQSVMEHDSLGLFFYPVMDSVFTDALGLQSNVRRWTLKLSSGVDRRVGNADGNKPLVFSQSLSNISRTAYTMDNESYRNVAYVAGEGEGTDRKWYELKINQNNSVGKQKGWNRHELWIDARDLQSEDSEGNKISQAEYEANIKNRAEEKAKENDISHSYESTVTIKRLNFRDDFDKGDLVTIKDDEIGVIIDAQIVAVTVTEQDSQKIVDVTLQYGKIEQNKIEKINNSLKKIEQIEMNVKYLNDVAKSSSKDYSFTGSYVTNVSGSSKKLFDIEWLRAKFKELCGIESGTNVLRYTVVAMNGDGSANAAHIDCVTYQNDDKYNGWYAVMDRYIKPPTRTRINYRVTVCLGDNFITSSD